MKRKNGVDLKNEADFEIALQRQQLVIERRRKRHHNATLISETLSKFISEEEETFFLEQLTQINKEESAQQKPVEPLLLSHKEKEKEKEKECKTLESQKSWEEEYNVNGDDDDDDDEKVEKIVIETLSKRPAVKDVERLLVKCILPRVSKDNLQEQQLPSRALIGAILSSLNSYPSVTLSTIICPLIQNGLGKPQSEIVFRVLINNNSSSSSSNIMSSIMSTICESPLESSQQMIGIFTRILNNKSSALLGNIDSISSVVSWLVTIEPDNRSSVPFATFLLSLINNCFSVSLTNQQQQQQQTELLQGPISRIVASNTSILHSALLRSIKQQK